MFIKKRVCKYVYMLLPIMVALVVLMVSNIGALPTISKTKSERSLVVSDRTIFLDEGEYWLDETIVLETTESLIGAGGRRTTIIHPPPGEVGIRIIGNDTLVQNIYVKGEDWNCSHGIVIEKTAYKVEIDNVAVTHCNGDGIRNEGAHSVTIDGYYGAYNKGNTLSLLTVEGWEPNANRILNSTLSLSDGYCAYVDGGEAVLFSGVVFEGSEYGLVTEYYDAYSSVLVQAGHFEQAPFWLKGDNAHLINCFGTEGDFIVEGDFNTLDTFLYSGSSTLTIAQGASQNNLINIYPYQAPRFINNGSYTYMRRGAVIYTPTYFYDDIYAGWSTIQAFRLFRVNQDYDTTGWGIAETGRFWLNQTDGLIKYWNGSELQVLSISP